MLKNQARESNSAHSPPSPLRGGAGAGVAAPTLRKDFEAVVALSQLTPTPTPPRKGEGELIATYFFASFSRNAAQRSRRALISFSRPYSVGA